MRVCITGGCGFIGSNLTEYLIQTEPDTEIVLVDLVPPCIELPPNVQYRYADIRNLKSLIDAFQGCREVYNLAGILGTSELLSVASLACEVNIVGACNVFDACLATGVHRVYNVAKPHFEGYAENAYTLTKHAGELLGLMYREKFGLEVATVRWLNAVGPHQHLYPVRKFVPMMTLLALYDLPLEVYGSGKQTIDPIDVVDMSRFTLHACRKGTGNVVVDLGSGEAISVNQGAEMVRETVKRLAGTHSTIMHIPMRPGEGDDINLKANMAYWHNQGMRTEVSFQASLDKTVRYVMDQPEYVRLNALRFYGKESHARHSFVSQSVETGAAV
jgi:nucleoside-diphosphate-sugar epimerase